MSHSNTKTHLSEIFAGTGFLEDVQPSPSHPLNAIEMEVPKKVAFTKSVAGPSVGLRRESHSTVCRSISHSCALGHDP